jgi:hypothetical protein
MAGESAEVITGGGRLTSKFSRKEIASPASRGRLMGWVTSPSDELFDRLLPS